MKWPIALGLLLEDLGRAVDALQGILDLVGHVGGDGGALLGLDRRLAFADAQVHQALHVVHQEIDEEGEDEQVDAS